MEQCSHYALLRKLSPFEQEIFLHCAMAEIIFHNPLKKGQTSVTTRGNSMLAIYTLQKEGLISEGEVWTLTKRGVDFFLFLKRRFDLFETHLRLEKFLSHNHEENDDD